MKKIISPILYAFSVSLVFILSIFTINFIENNFGLHTLLRNGDIDAVITILFFGGIIFSYTTKIITKFENNEVPIFSDHLRQSFLLYFIFIFLTIQNIINSSYTSPAIQDALVVVISMIALFGIIVNFVVLRRLAK